MRSKTAAYFLGLICALGAAAREGPEGGSEAVVEVGGVVLTRLDVERALARAGRSLKLIDPKRRPEAIREVAEGLVERELARQFLATSPMGASEEEAALKAREMAATLQGRGIVWTEYLKARHHTRASWQREFHFELAWRRYRERMVTEANIRRHFERHRKRFDGTRRRVAHLWIPRPENASARRREAARLAAIRQSIREGRLSFEDAVKRYSQAPSAGKGGAIGWIERHAPMGEAFSRAAFAIPPGGISEVVETPHGWHLIRCLEEKPGTRTLADVHDHVRRDLERYLLKWLEDKQRARSRVRWRSPYDRQE